MATDSTDAFAAEVEGARPSREELERQLAELDQEGGQELATGDDGQDYDADTEGDDEDAYTRPIVQVRNDFLGREIGIIKPTDVDLMMFQNDMGSKVLNDNQRMARNGDFCREHVVADDYEAWEDAVRRRAAREPRRGAVIFYEALQELVQQIAEQQEETDETEMNKAVNRAERRAALRAKANRGR